ncbi:bicaudal C homolog 2 isoform X2 [Paramormyrops kingsleyae]|uniref:bicaudal C homolog 2 isoform X2 n=1 Tax=Paramormyrops kingsleyae TaxID=1676925 RepID=UPI000CD5CFCB|nr:protein bicaudal C homolog 1-B-like isoform X2 [Paramormyrops kingsleyae]
MASSVEDLLDRDLCKLEPMAQGEALVKPSRSLSRPEEEEEEEEEEEDEEEEKSALPEAEDVALKPCDPDWVEERFRIDRKKLEMMLLSPPEENGLSGEEFFKKVMIETNTQIKWPSKLKIGAKSKKDPHVKVEGKRENVLEAKKKILDLLETKVNKVTLKIDVTHTEHSHVIGKGGGNIKKVMEVTECHIHFPDSNRHNATGEKSNQVSIAGPVEGVESARRKIRDLQPLVLTFDLPMMLTSQVMPEVSSPVVQHVAQAFGVSISFRQQPRFYSCSCIVRGLQGNSASLKKATCMLMEMFLGPENHVAVSTQLDISSQQHLLLGHGATSFLTVMHMTHTQIILPDLSAPQSPPSLLIQGAPDGVCLARQQLLDCLPVCLMFDMRENGEADPRKLSHIMQNLGVFISIKPKVKQTAKSVVVKTLEKNVGNLYEARRLLLRLDPSEVTNVAAKPTGDITLTGLNNHWLNMMMQQLRLSDQGAATAPEGVQDSPQQVKTTLSPPPGLSVVQKECIIMVKETDPKSEKVMEDKSQLSSSDPGSFVPGGQGLDVREKAAYFHRRSSQSEAIRDQNPEGIAALSHHMATQNTNKLILNASLNSSRTERRNSSREDTIQTGSNSTSNEDYDYEKKRLLATRAMQKKPVETEVRTPTDTWSGLGFSKSMPTEVVKELRSISRRSYKSYLGTATQQTWASQNGWDRIHNGSDSENWRERRGSSPSPSLLLPSSSSYSPSSFSVSYSSSSFRSSSPRASTDKPLDGYFERSSSESRAGPSTHNLPELLGQLGLSKYIEIFQQQEIDFQTFLTLSDADLKEVGVSTFGARRKMLLAISDLKNGKWKTTDPPVVKSAYLEGGASGRLPRILDADVATRNNCW